MKSLVLRPESQISPADLEQVAIYGRQVQLHPDAINAMQACCKTLDTLRDDGHLIYGLTTGFGPLADQPVAPEDIELLQKNLVYHLASGTGRPMQKSWARAMMLSRAICLSRGHSAVHPSTVELLITWLNKDITPSIHRYGTVGASGDLTPLAHLALAMMGEGEILIDGQSHPAQPANIGDTCSDDLFCTVNTTCSDQGTCEGEPMDCSAEDDQCNEGICDEDAGACVAEPTNIGQSCADDLFCTVNTTCSDQGTCEGEDRNCDHLDETCQVGYCDEALASCELINQADQTQCDTRLYCSVNEVCEDGQCVGELRDCTALDDDCHDGVCDEASGDCIAIFTCDPCDGGTPTANAGPDQEVVPNTQVTLDGSGSSDPNDQNLSYDWQIQSRPDGSTATLSSTTAENPILLADVAGEFVICMTASNPDECTSDESCMTLTVVPGDGLHIELTWGSTSPSDLDLHYRAPGGEWFSGYVSTGPPGQRGCTGDDADSVWFCVPNPDWGGNPAGTPDGIAENDPYLDVDDFFGDAPENINQDVLFDGEGFRVGVHHFTDYGNGPKEARLRIYFNGLLVFEEFHTIGCLDFWEVADIDVSNTGTIVDITSLDRATFASGLGGTCD